ncbi:Glycosyltransferase involved in cell wall bisynthesis [Mucilaginibacter pineti]|uniref:Glycosyltransferase involved in cell wall bisynthesis n=1 Tax=Mucilaginibacter pineti TaxID=1391627 RepID=A0A1G7H7K8_9SPHI|nr:glycosyltransferase family 1 protein [Mucilaginibacter pineti]SDE96313.1 Glycosyltransferase involved in cell wall bisynthesis [Mucilaginibacter pineti]
MKSLNQQIALISEHASPLADLGGVDTGGQNVYVTQLARYLAKGKQRVDIFTRWEDESLPQVVNWQPGIRVVHIAAGPQLVIPKEDILPYMHEFKQNMLAFILAEDIRYDLIHANFFMSGLVAAGIKEALNIPFVITFHALGHVRKIHQGDNDRFPAERLQIEADIVQQADAIIAECPQDKDDLINHYNAPISRITIIPCGFSEEEFHPVEKPLARKKLNIPQKAKVLLQLGRMVPRKGVDNVVKALAELKKMGKQVLLVIVGGEQQHTDIITCPERKRLMDIAQKAGVLDMIHFAGRKDREQLKYYYSAADLFVTTPWYEPFGITPLESMACGTPVIGSNVGGIKYSVLDGKTGALVPPHDPKALANAIVKLLSNKQALEKMSINALNRVKRYFTWANVAVKVDALYKKVLRNTTLQRTIEETKAA